MTTTEIVTLLSGPGAVALYAAGVKGLRWWAGYRERRALANEAVDIAKIEAVTKADEREERHIDRLWDRVDVLEKSKDDCLEALAETRASVARGEVERVRDKEECSQRIAALESKVPADITAKIRTEARREVRRSLSDPHGIPAQPDEGGDE